MPNLNLLPRFVSEIAGGYQSGSQISIYRSCQEVDNGTIEILVSNRSSYQCYDRAYLWTSTYIVDVHAFPSGKDNLLNHGMKSSISLYCLRFF